MYTGLLTARSAATQLGAAAAATHTLGGLVVSSVLSTEGLLQVNLDTLHTAWSKWCAKKVCQTQV
jgi:hypothetical protein